MKESLKFEDNKIVVTTTYDREPVIEQNKISKQTNNYKGSMVHAGRLHLGDVERLKNMGYNLLSPDPEEVKRALLYIQTNEPYLLCIEGKPFSKVKTQWT